MAAYQKMDTEAPDALAAFAVLLDQYPDDPLSYYHYKRLQQGETGSIITMSNK
jgi:hypothetical protein